MSAKIKRQRRQAYRLVGFSALIVLAGCVLPIAALHSGRSVSHDGLLLLEVMSVAALALLLAQLVFKK